MFTTMCPKEQHTSDNLIVKDYCFIIEIFDKFSFGGFLWGCLEAIFHKAEFSARSDIFFCLKTNWRRVGVKRQKKISFRAENSA